MTTKIALQFNGPVEIGQLNNEPGSVSTTHNHYARYLESGEEDPRTAMIPAKFTQEQKEIIQRMADERGIAVSRFVWEAMRLYMASLGEELEETQA